MYSSHHKDNQASLAFYKAKPRPAHYYFISKPDVKKRRASNESAETVVNFWRLMSLLPPESHHKAASRSFR